MRKPLAGNKLSSGHARSGAWVPVETTVLNEKANFQQAVMTAVKNWEDKFSKGP